ncbi:ribonuclease HI family protein [Candidatus Daviesbacteria bacterium]|nr:ribonuclease HI family protein [Candidatus Daviesbacteria bacterium]
MKLIIYTDGACRGNPGPASYGFTISSEEGKLLHEEGKFIGVTTNNVAEYTAVLEALKHAQQEYAPPASPASRGERGEPAGGLEIELYADSKLVAEQLSGRYKIKNPRLKAIFEQIKILELNIGRVFYNHIPRFKNTLADKLANQALDK